MQKRCWINYLLVIMMCIFMMTGCKTMEGTGEDTVTQGDPSIKQEAAFQTDQLQTDQFISDVTQDDSVDSKEEETTSDVETTSDEEQQNSVSNQENESTSNNSNKEEELDSSVTVTGDGVKVHFIDVGQGDSILVETDGASLLIDAGENNQGSVVVNYLKSLGIDTLDYVIGTHPHSDHIGGLDIVIEELKVKKVILPVVDHSTKTYEDVLLAISKKGLKITKPVVGTEYELGEGTFTIIAPNSMEYSDLNDYSVGIRLVYGDTSFVFVGDADEVSEIEMCNNGLNLSADVLKLNHHGSAYSNTNRFINAVSPTYAVISVGEGNSYGHPHREVLEDMSKRGIEVYRTDLLGTIIVESDGKNITFEAQRTSNVSMESQISNEETSQSVYITDTGTKYHQKGCSYLKSSCKEISLDQAVEDGYSPCSRCN